MKTFHAEGAMYFKYVEAQMSSRWCGMEVRRGDANSGVILVTRPWFKTRRYITNSPQTSLQLYDKLHQSYWLEKDIRQTSEQLMRGCLQWMGCGE
ncbi:hypothetical protein TNCV_562971 [Trichonephila clavipes]|nr:hypothetical protein TNCV_562971 [Trichonephila clavipes]